MSVPVRKLLRKARITVPFHPRERMRRRPPELAAFHTPQNPPLGSSLLWVPPVTALPVDSTGNATVDCPMDGNDTLGDCFEACIAHIDNIWTYGQGKSGWTESVFDLGALEQQYEAASGGDNGLDENEAIAIWQSGVGGNKAATVVDYLDVDLTDVALVQFAIDQFYAVALEWSVPDDFLNGWTTGSVWPNAMTPDPNNGHATPLASVWSGQDQGQDVTGFYELWTWGGYCLVSAAFVASVDPTGFVALSARQFNAQGYDSKGRHVSTQAALWIACGGNADRANALVATFPAIGPTPTPVPVPPSPPVPVPPVPPAPPSPPTPPGSETMVLTLTDFPLTGIRTALGRQETVNVSGTGTVTLTTPSSSKYKEKTVDVPTERSTASNLVGLGLSSSDANELADAVFAFAGSGDYLGAVETVVFQAHRLARANAINPTNLQLILAFLLELLPLILPLITGG